MKGEDFVWALAVGPRTKDMVGAPWSYFVQAYRPVPQADGKEWKIEKRDLMPIRLEDGKNMVTRFVVATVANVDEVRKILDGKVGNKVPGITEGFVHEVLESLWGDPTRTTTGRVDLIKDYKARDWVRIRDTITGWTGKLKKDGRLHADAERAAPTRDLLLDDQPDGWIGAIHIP